MTTTSSGKRGRRTETEGTPVKPLAPEIRPRTRAERLKSIMGKYAYIPFSSEDHARAKTREIEEEG